jgi:hypothetical protein
MELQLKRDRLQEVKEGIKVGDLFFDKRGEEIIRIQEIEEKQYRKDDPSTKYLLVSYKRLVSFVENKWTDPYHSSLKELNNYYSLNSPIANLDDLYKRGLDAQINGIQDYEVSSSFEASTELVAMNSKENLLAMKDSIEILQSKTTQLQKMLNFQLCEMKEKFDIMRRKLDNQLSIMMRQVEKIMRVIRVIELYLGIEEELFQLQAGQTADENEPLTLRQKVLFMDEEVGILDDQGLDWTQIDQFDEWLLKDKHYEILIPEKKAIVVFKPRRKNKVYYDAYDRRREEIDEQNKMPYFLIRNGENLYRVYTDKMTVPERLFPRKKEFQEILDKMKIEDNEVNFFDKEKIQDLTYYYQRIVFFIQGLIDRTDIFSPMKEKINLMNNIEQSQETLRLIYDDELCLPTNRLPFAEWKKMINSTIEEGSRIVYCPSIENRWKSPKQRLYEERFLKSYSEWSLPTFPGEGVYTVYKTFINDIYWKEHKRIEEKREQLGIRYIPDDPRWDWNGSHERKNSLFFKFEKDESTIINYDQLNLDDIEFYLNSRIDRPNYLEYLPILKKLKKCLLEEQDQEDAFYLMLVGRCQKEGLKPKEGLSYEKIIGELIDWWKYKNKWKRPISKNDELAMKMIEKRLFAKTNRSKWFKS